MSFLASGAREILTTSRLIAGDADEAATAVGCSATVWRC